MLIKKKRTHTVIYYIILATLLSKIIASAIKKNKNNTGQALFEIQTFCVSPTISCPHFAKLTDHGNGPLATIKTSTKQGCRCLLPCAKQGQSQNKMKAFL